MAKPKTPRPDSQEKLDDFLSNYEERSGLLNLLLQTDAVGKLYQRKEISESARSLELVMNLVEGIDDGELSEDDWNSLVSDDTASVNIPISLLRPIAAGWKKFSSGEAGYSLSDALKLGKSRQGERIAASIKSDREKFVFAFKIELIRFFSALEGDKISIETAIGKFSEASGVEDGRLKKAYNERIEDVRAINERLGFPILPPE